MINIPNTLILDKDILDQYGLHRGDVAVEPDANHDYINGDITCDHFPQVADFFDATVPLPNNAEFVSQDVPSNVAPGDTVSVSITMKNTGENTWNDVESFIDNCDYLDGWKSSGQLNLNSTTNKQGYACLVFNGSGSNEFEKIFTTPYSIGGSESDLALEFWYYVSDPSQLTDVNQVELGSGGAPDIDEYNWNLSGLTKGWNHIRLSFSDASKKGNPDLNSINWFRLYQLKGLVTTMIDGIKIGVKDDYNVSINEFKNKGIQCVYPNPVYDDDIHVKFNVESLSAVSMSVFDMKGSLVAKPNNKQFFEAGEHEVNIPLCDVFPGIYLLEVKINERRQYHKFSLL
ncbi:MAG: T9SS type A sorting domain-containing protein [Prolixibacteraceae bacterium]|nr:T9SS type A sorting domain-containing protein [Prolixibacteraceae bacterium]